NRILARLRRRMVRTNSTRRDVDDLANLQSIGIDARISSLDSLDTDAKFGSNRCESITGLNRILARLRRRMVRTSSTRRDVDDLANLQSIGVDTRVGCFDSCNSGIEFARDRTEGVPCYDSVPVAAGRPPRQ